MTALYQANDLVNEIYCDLLDFEHDNREFVAALRLQLEAIDPPLRGGIEGFLSVSHVSDHLAESFALIRALEGRWG
jgi:hypothetical protein